jgi:sugar phosphate isomerase/epimerase
MAILSLNETTTFRWSFEDDVANYSAAGIHAIGIWRQKLSDCGLERARELIRQHHLKVSHLFWAGGFTGSAGHSYRESVDDTIDALRTAADLGAGCLIVCGGARAGHTYNHARRLVQQALEELVPLAEEYGVVMALEPMHPGCAAQCTFLNKLDEALEIIEAIDRPQVKLLLDTYHLGQDSDLVERIPRIAAQVALVQLGDAKTPPCGEQNRCRLGHGMVPLKEIVCGLRLAGYDGFYDVELLGQDVEAMDYHDLLAHAKEAFCELMQAR